MDKERIMKYLYIISIVLAILCLVTTVSSFMNLVNSDEVIWHGIKFPVDPSMSYEKSDTSINFTGKYDSQNINITITNDTTDFNRTVPKVNETGIFIGGPKTGVYIGSVTSDFNGTHKMVSISSDDKSYIFLIPSDNINDDGDTIIGNPTIIECVGTNGDYMYSFLINSQGGY